MIFLDQEQPGEAVAAKPTHFGEVTLHRRGPVFFKLLGRVRYRLEDVETFEAENVRVPR